MSKTGQLEDFFGRARDAFYRSASPQSRLVDLGPITVELGLAESLRQRDWTLPLALRPATRETASGSLLAWDDSLHDSQFPAPPWGSNYVYTRRGDVRGYADPRFCLAYNYQARLLTMWDRQQRLGIYWTPHLRSLPDYEWAAPMRTLLHWLGLEHGLQLTHAAAVGADGQGLLLAGKGGSGKSTTAVACWYAGMSLVSDDYCWVTSQPEPRAWALYHSARLLPKQPTDLPDLAGEPSWSGDKVALNLAQINPSGLSPWLHLKALLMPQLARISQAGLRPASAEEGLRALALTSIGQLAGAGPHSLKLLEPVARALPAYSLDLCHPVSSVPPLLRSLLESL